MAELTLLAAPAGAAGSSVASSVPIILRLLRLRFQACHLPAPVTVRAYGRVLIIVAPAMAAGDCCGEVTAQWSKQMPVQGPPAANWHLGTSCS